MSGELEQLKSDYALLKKKLDDQEIFQGNMVVDSVKSKVGYITMQERVEYVFAVLAILLSPTYHTVFGVSWWFCLATVLFMLFCGYWTWMNHHKLRVHADDEDMLTVVKNVKALRQKYVGWFRIAIPLLLVWVSWLVAEIIIRCDKTGLAVVFCAAVFAGLLIGGAIGLKMHRSVIRTCDDIISQIEG